MSRRILGLLVITAFWTSSVFAVFVYTTDGKVYEGSVTQETKRFVTVELDNGPIVLSRAEILKISNDPPWKKRPAPPHQPNRPMMPPVFAPPVRPMDPEPPVFPGRPPAIHPKSVPPIIPYPPSDQPALQPESEFIPFGRTGISGGVYELQNVPLNHSVWYAGFNFARRYSPQFELAVEAGWNPKTLGNNQYHVFPVMLTARYYPIRVRWTAPYLTGSFGVVPGLMSSPQVDGSVYGFGFGGKLGAGLEFFMGEAKTLAFEAGYVFAQSTFEKSSVKEKFTMDGLYVTTGVRF